MKIEQIGLIIKNHKRFDRNGVTTDYFDIELSEILGRTFGLSGNGPTKIQYERVLEKHKQMNIVNGQIFMTPDTYHLSVRNKQYQKLPKEKQDRLIELMQQITDDYLESEVEKETSQNKELTLLFDVNQKSKAFHIEQDDFSLER